MGLRYRRSKNIGGFRVTMSQAGVSCSVGGKGVRYTRRADGRTQTTLSAPGTGLYYTQTEGQSRKKKDRASAGRAFEVADEDFHEGDDSIGDVLEILKTRICPFCDEIVKRTTTRCKFCRTDISSAGAELGLQALDDAHACWVDIRDQDAVAHIEDAVQYIPISDPSFLEALVFYGQILTASNRQRDAADVYEYGLNLVEEDEQHPNAVDLWEAWANFCEESDDCDQAAEFYERALKALGLGDLEGVLLLLDLARVVDLDEAHQYHDKAIRESERFKEHPDFGDLVLALEATRINLQRVVEATHQPVPLKSFNFPTAISGTQSLAVPAEPAASSGSISKTTNAQTKQISRHPKSDQPGKEAKWYQVVPLPLLLLLLVPGVNVAVCLVILWIVQNSPNKED